MYPEAGLMFFPYLNGLLPDLGHNQQLELLRSIREDDLSSVVQSRTVTEYDLGGLFKAPEPIVEDPATEYDIVAAAISSMISPEESAGDLATAIEVSISDSRNNLPENSKSLLTGGDHEMQRSDSSGSLRSTRPNFLDFQVMDLESAFGMRRAYSEGDIQVPSTSCSAITAFDLRQERGSPAKAIQIPEEEDETELR